MTDEVSAVDVRVHAPVKDTEVPERVEQAVRNLFPDADVTAGDAGVDASARDLAHLATLIENHRIPDTARNVMLHGREPDRPHVTRFRLGKQAAFVGKPAFGPPEGPLGEITVEVEAPDAATLERFLFAVAPDTTVPEELARVPPDERPVEDEGAMDEEPTA